jgi:hypothetical protein
LDLSGNDIGGYGGSSADAMTALGASLVACGNVTNLDISKNLEPEDISGFAKHLKDMGSLSKLKMDKCELPVQEIKTATELDLSNKGLGELDAIVIAVLITVCKLQNRFVTN